MARRLNEHGMALIVVMGLMALIVFLGLAVFQYSLDEIRMAANESAMAQSQYLAEAGVARTVRIFHDPGDMPAGGSFPRGYPESGRGIFFEKRKQNAAGGASFTGQAGESQFEGTETVPDYLYENTGGSSGSFSEGLEDFGFLESLRIYGPEGPRSIVTVEAVGRSRGGGLRRVKVRLAPSAMPAVTAALQTEHGASQAIPVLIHWGDARVLGEADWGGSLDELPKKDPFAVDDGFPYGPGERRDGWADFYSGERVLAPDASDCADCENPFWIEGHENIHQLQNEFAGPLLLDEWGYDRLKALARQYGVYFGTDDGGNLYLDGIKDPGHLRSPEDLLAAGKGDGRPRLVFVDTVDARRPDGSNLAAIDLPVDSAAGYYFIHANVVIREAGPGATLEVLTPPVEGTNDAATRRPVSLNPVHLNGILYSAGRLSVEGHPSVYGAVISGGGFGGSGDLEVWYNADFRTGDYPGLPVVTVPKGGWYSW